MKIEKINDHQIRCTLTKEDLANREIKLSELAYGSDKVKALFRDMMVQASHDFGFEANDIPLMIEAIPLSADSIILIITKVEDPEELDTRFSRFSPSPEESASTKASAPKPEGADDILSLIKKLHEARTTSPDNASSDPESELNELPQEDIHIILTRMYTFSNLDTLTQVSRILQNVYHGENAVYKDDAESEYYLIASQGTHTPEEFNKICNILCEYSSNIPYFPATEGFFQEHLQPLIQKNALQKLSCLA